MRKTLLGILLLALTLLVGCQSAAPESVLPASEPAPTTPTELLPTPEPTEVVIETDYCVECHTDKEQLIASAIPEEVVESESSGAG